MSRALYNLGGLRFWDEREIEFREYAIRRISNTVRTTLLGINSAWQFIRCEGPCLSPREQINSSYDHTDIFITNHKAGQDFLCLRAETTPSSYQVARNINGRLPICVWQSGKSFRRETSDGATAAKMRYNEFYQLEFQCIYSDSTKADYRQTLLQNVGGDLEFLVKKPIRFVNSDRLPSYSQSTIDIEAHIDQQTWREIASCSIRNDFSDQSKVAEIAIGLDRVVDIHWD
jgi:glycyl-tRNA synthetase